MENAQSDIDQIDADLKEANRELRGIHSVGGQMKNALTSSKYEHVDRSKLSKDQRLELARLEKEEREREAAKGKKGKKGEKKKTIDDILAEKKAEEEEARKKDTFLHLIEGGEVGILFVISSVHNISLTFSLTTCLWIHKSMFERRSKQSMPSHLS